VKRSDSGPWLDASGPDDAAKYQRAPEARAWKGFAAPEDLSRSASGSLLQNKRGRSGPPVGPQASKGAGTDAQKTAQEKVSGRLQRLSDLRGTNPPRPQGH
jgi:hypothetical protein